MTTYTIELYWKDTLLGTYSVDTVKKLFTVHDHIPFGFMETSFGFKYENFENFLKGRMVDRGRVDRKELLGYTSTPPTVWEEMLKTQGFDIDDFLWLNFKGLHTMTISDFHPRLNEKAVSVYDKTDFE